MVRSCGLLTGKNNPVALKSIAVTLSINDFVAGVSATLNYENEEKVPLEAFFVFPMDEDSAVYSFEALVDGKTIVAELQDKNKAHCMYEEALSQGFQAYLLEEDKCSRDVFCCNVGNLEAGSKVALTLRYVQELPLEADGAVRYVLPAILNPRYRLSERCMDTCLDMKTPIVPLEDLPYTLSMVATINSQHGIKKVQSNCSLSSTEYFGDGRTSAQVSLAEGHKFDRDVELLIYYSRVHSPSVALEMGTPEMEPDSLMGDPSAMVSFYPNIPVVETSITCGEFVFLMDCSGSMKNPMNNQDRSQLRIDAAKETLILLLKSLPIGCYFNIYVFGSSYEAFFLDSVKYTQESMEEAVERVKLMLPDLGGTEILSPLRNIYRKRPIPGHPLQLFVFTDGEIFETFSVIKEVRSNSQKHRCFSFGIGQGVSTSLIKSIARVSGGTSEFITGKDKLQTKALRSLKRSLQSVVEDVSISWNLPPELSVNVISPEETVIFSGQRLIVYAQLMGTMPSTETLGEVCLKYTFNGKNFEEKVTFSLQPKLDANLTIHRLAAKCLIQTKDFGFKETSIVNVHEVKSISLESGVMSSFTAFVAINKDLNAPVQGPLVHRDIPRIALLGGSPTGTNIPCGFPKAVANPMPPAIKTPRSVPVHFCAVMTQKPNYKSQESQCNQRKKYPAHKESSTEMKKRQTSTNKTKMQRNRKGFDEHDIIQLIYLQNANGSWDMDENLAKVLGISLEDMQASHPTEVVEPAVWATMLAVIWLHTNGRDYTWEWSLLERKAIAWLQNHPASTLTILVGMCNKFLKSSVNPAVFTM